MTVSGNIPKWETNANTDTPYKAKIYAGASSGATANATATNGNVHLNLVQENNDNTAIKLIGAGATSVTSAAGVITVTSANTWRNVFAYKVGEIAASEILTSSINTLDLEFGSDFL